MLVHVEHETDGKLCVFLGASAFLVRFFLGSFVDVARVRNIPHGQVDATLAWPFWAVLVTSNCGGRWFTARQSNLPIFVVSPFFFSR